MTPFTVEECQEAIDAYEALGGDAGARIGRNRDQMTRLRKKAKEYGLFPKEFGRLTEREIIDRPLPKKGKVARYILTSAQSNTKVFGSFWRNLLAYADYCDAEIMVGRMRYNKTARLVAQEKEDGTPDNGYWYAKEIEPYVCDSRVRLCDGFIWFGDMNIMPTAVNPLSGLDSFGGDESGSFPHTKIALRSIATHPTVAAKKLYTTGTVTQINYIDRKAGKKAEFHHAFGALLVEVDSDGNFFPRHLNADKSGTFYDLDAKVSKGKVTRGDFVKVAVMGDVHARNMDPEACKVIWGKGGFVDTYRPKNQVIHDLLDFESKSHHNDLFDEYELHCKGKDSVEDEIEETCALLQKMERDGMKTYVVSANHNDHLTRWLKEANIKSDMLNAPFYLEALAACFRAIREKNESFVLLDWAIKRAGKTKAKFLGRLDSLIIDGVRLDQHGDIGANGSRGSAQQFAKLGEKSTVGHSHAMAIHDGCYQVPTLTNLLLDYVQGMSNWSHGLGTQAPNGKRQLIDIKNGKIRA